MKVVFIITTIIASTVAMRPFYAGSGGEKGFVPSQFRDTSDKQNLPTPTQHFRSNSNGQRVTSGADLQSGDQRNQEQRRFGEPVGTETRTIRPPLTKGSYAGSVTRTKFHM
ncbi:uncharacterized protein LOC115885797 isoform X2 [Sitophilus oryzae]|uniref:Uncharacterized protein LOC115885797 isoform X2 n=1 Tax=Sitophilus oryzae TaxID=7048 RepID=A0A6J2YBN8_SITOR|nr:uncharacterized protein LOC115885797 isoform X2 [Sitophilus oryzae]